MFNIGKESTLVSIGLRATLVGFALAVSAGRVIAHGDNHPQPATGGAVKAEQRPFGIAGDPRHVSRDIEIDMNDDMRFLPSVINVTVGDTVRFRLKNRGALLHEMVIGTMAGLREHAATMRRFPEMRHSEPYMAHVKPGTSEEIVWTFNRPGEFHYACLIAGHFEAGMVGTAVVKPRSRAIRPQQKS